MNQNSSAQATNHSCYLIGSDSLLIECAGLLVQQGISILGVITGSSRVSEWASQKGLPVLSDTSDYGSELAKTPFDYLFSITHLAIIPDSVLELPKKIAINFHDGLLPAYAGLNTPVWGIINGEQQYGITWHQITSGVDEGDILKQALFDVADDETSLSINIKCFEHALASFAELLNELQTENLSPIKQDLSQRQYFGKYKRPAAAGIINWNDSAQNISRLVRALNFGNYDNPVSSAKLSFDIPVTLVSAVVSDESSSAAAGTVLTIDNNELKIATGDGVLSIDSIRHVDGSEIDVAELSKRFQFSPNQQITSLPDDSIAEIEEITQKAARQEKYWHQILKNLDPLELPYCSSIGANRDSIQYTQLPIETNCSVQQIQSAYCLLLARLSRKYHFDIATQFDPVSDQVKPLMSNYSILRLNINSEQTLGQLLDDVGQQVSSTASKGYWQKDFIGRSADLASIPELKQSCALPIGLSISHSAEAVKGSALTLCIKPDNSTAQLAYDDSQISSEDAQRFVAQLQLLIKQVSEQPNQLAKTVDLLSENEKRQLFSEWNATSVQYDNTQCIHHLFENIVAKQPQQTAIRFQNQSLTYAELNERANQLATQLMEKGVKPDDLVGVHVNRSLELMIATLGIMKAGAAYVPLDPAFPKDRISYMIEDAEMKWVISQEAIRAEIEPTTAEIICTDNFLNTKDQNTGNPNDKVDSANLAYVIYTSGSTGRPKGVMVEHRNVVNFFVGMDERIDVQPEQKVWLAVTSISFDISVLELFWTLTRGFEVVIYSDKEANAGKRTLTAKPNQAMDFSLFYWNVATEEDLDAQDKYRLLLEGAKFADTHQFKAIWTPERHFASFGGLYPNPAVTGAAIATITKQLEIRAGSCVVPLHSPIRIAEEWSVVDNLSNGRVGIAAAAGWAPPDFAILPQNFENAKGVMLENIETVRRLWRGERITFPGPKGDVEVRTLPKPIQKELPIWITTAGNPDSYRSAAKMGANILTHLLGQTVEEVGEKVKIYRDTWKECGHPGEGKITLMLHTFVGESMEQVEDVVRQPMKDYLKSAMFLVKDAAWNFPTFKKLSEETGKTLDDYFATIADDELDALLEFAFQRYFTTSGLFGTPDSCVAMIDKCKGIGVNEIGCLIDFGIDSEKALEHLPYLDQVRQRTNIAAPTESNNSNEVDYSVPALIERHKVTHFQCTPSMATMLTADATSREQLKTLQHMMVGGEAFPTELAQDLHQLVSGKVTNMYGPTETTIWSSTHDLDGKPGSVSIGKPIANTDIYIVDENMQLMPPGVPGELVIGGDGVVRGYFHRPELTAERFVSNPYREENEARCYHTGDLAQFEHDGTLSYVGRMDFQIKIRGYRIELGEIESLLQAIDSVRDAVVILREDSPGDKRLVAYVTPTSGATIEQQALFEQLGEHLPEYMVPSLIVELTKLPLTPNGKIDRKALPAPTNKTRSKDTEVVVPQNEVESIIAEVWKQALDIEDVSTQDVFFEIGGHSLLVVQILTALNGDERIKKSIKMTDLFRYTTIASLADFIGAEEEQAKGLQSGQARASSRKAAMGRRRTRRN